MVLVKEAENAGIMVGMSGVVSTNRTDLNNELHDYFRSKFPKYTGTFDEYDGEDILYRINGYMAEKGIDKHPLDFPMTSGTVVQIIPINENIQLKVVVADEYYGDGDYVKYVVVDSFKINEQTTKKDVDELLDFVNQYLS